MLENLTTTQFLAGLIGLYFLAAGPGLLSDRNSFSGLLKELNTQPMLGYLGGIIAFAIGGAIVGVHNDWSSLLSGFVSLVGWISLAEGVLMLACRKWYLGLFTRIALSPGLVTAFGLGTLIIGVVLIATVFFG